jgi:hypothetical protein
MTLSQAFSRATKNSQTHGGDVEHFHFTPPSEALMRSVCSLVLLATIGLTHTAIAAEIAKPATAPTTRPFILSKETTYVTGPVRKDGTIDYVAATNLRLSKGVTKENNAAIPFLEAVTQTTTGMEPHYAKLRKELGVAEPAANAKNANNIPEIGNLLDETLIAPWTAQKFPEVVRYLDSMKGPLDLLVEASKRDEFYMPLVREHEDDSLVSVLLPHLQHMRRLCNSLKSRALLCLGNEDIKGFRRDAIAIVRISRLSTHAPTMIESMVGISCEAMGLDAIKIATSGSWLSEAESNQLLADLRAAPARRKMYEVLEGCERGTMLEFLQISAVHGVATAQKMLQPMGKDAPVFSNANATTKDWNAALRKANAWYDRLADSGKIPDYADRIKAADAVMHDIGELKSKYDGWKGIFAPIEDQLVTLLVPAMQRAYTLDARIAANEELTETALALLAFRTKLGEYPPQLKLLVPTYFKAEPIDPFTGISLTYKTVGAGYELMSAGPGTKDVRAKSDDLVIRVGN